MTNPTFGHWMAWLILSAIATTILSLILGRFFRTTRLVDHPDTIRKRHAHPVPRVGGLSIALTLLVAASVIHSFHPIVLFMLTLFSVGLLDDLCEFHAFWKLFIQITAVSLFFLLSPLSPPVSLIRFLLQILWVVLIINAVNYMDNSHGLCAGVAGMITAGFGVLALYSFNPGSMPPVIYPVILGSILGFLSLNYPHGKVFLGDSGSHLLGAWIAIQSLPTFHLPIQFQPSLGYLLIILVPLLDMFQVSMSRYRRGLPIWQADNHHLAHVLMRRGWSSTTAVGLLWILTLLTVGTGCWFVIRSLKLD